MTEQVSTLKKSRAAPSDSANDDDGFGIDNGSFKWNAVEEKDKEQKDADPKSRAASEDTIAVSTSESSSLSDAESADHRFELRNISVIFPDGQLTCVTGPTASGKTALLVSNGTNLYPDATDLHWCADGSSWGDDASPGRPHRHVQELVQS